MSVGIAAKLTGTLFLLSLVFVNASAQFDASPVRIMFYNVENLFDVDDDPVTEDEEFLPGGLRRWNYSRYKKKIISLYKTIVAAGEWEPPAVVGLCEIENRSVVEDLVYGTNLSKFKYQIIHEDSPDERGIDVCLICREGIVELIDYQYLNPFASDSGFKTRDVLYTKMQIRSDTIHFIVNHWPSRRGGVLAGEAERRRVAEMVRTLADSICSEQADAKIIMMGDLNATPDDQTTVILTEMRGGNAGLVNLSAGLPESSGTYCYRGTWETIDQVMVSEALVRAGTGLCTGTEHLRVFRPDFLLKKDPQYPGYVPFATYSGYRYQGGFSDHLPVLLDLLLR
ncbi:MAG: endonuclease/exonuclease/phosphatase family protein [Bacteroidota bacterium]